MHSVWIKIDSISTLKQFVADCETIELELEALGGEHMANAKSLIGMMTLPLLGPLRIRFEADPEQYRQVLEKLQPYVM